jgi:hypothetical protein
MSPSFGFVRNDNVQKSASLAGAAPVRETGRALPAPGCVRKNECTRNCEDDEQSGVCGRYICKNASKQLDIVLIEYKRMREGDTVTQYISRLIPSLIS